jgi:hypothetical protein
VEYVSFGTVIAVAAEEKEEEKVWHLSDER